MVGPVNPHSECAESSCSQSPSFWQGRVVSVASAIASSVQRCWNDFKACCFALFTYPYKAYAYLKATRFSSLEEAIIGGDVEAQKIMVQRLGVDPSRDWRHHIHRAAKELEECGVEFGPDTDIYVENEEERTYTKECNNPEIVEEKVRQYLEEKKISNLSSSQEQINFLIQALADEKCSFAVFKHLADQYYQNLPKRSFISGNSTDWWENENRLDWNRDLFIKMRADLRSFLCALVSAFSRLESALLPPFDIFVQQEMPEAIKAITAILKYRYFIEKDVGSKQFIVSDLWVQSDQEIYKEVIVSAISVIKQSQAEQEGI